jgi:taurine dioxygenase
MRATDLRIAPLTPAIGAEIGGIDLSQPVGPATADAIYQALIDHHVIFFRD